MRRLSRTNIRRLRLASGLVLFLYVFMHLLNHAFGIRSLEDMGAAARFLLDPWQSLPGLVLLYGAGAIHLALGFLAFYRRRHLRMPGTEIVQLTLGLSIPLLLISHAAAVRIGEATFNLQIGYSRVIYQYFIVAPDGALPKQILLLIVVWIHGCLGIRAWLSSRPWYPRWVPTLTAMATLLPVVSLLGFINAGLDMRELAASNPGAIPAHDADVPGTPQAEQFATVYRSVDRIALGYVVLLAALLAARVVRDWHGRRFRAIRITYPEGRTITVPEGFSVLEASRWSGIPHASVCGGRGRCSTCRVDVIEGGEQLPPPGPDEARLLARIGAPPSVRLACQIRPVADISVVPLVHSAAPSPAAGMPSGGRRETDVAALFVDLRQSTSLADDRLPYDTLFIVERYVAAVSNAVRESGGQVVNVAGDGIMSVFGARGGTGDGTRAAFLAASRLWKSVEDLNAELRGELPQPLRFGIGLHVGLAVVGLRWQGGMEGMPFLGDTGNVAARLEGETKRLDCTMVASREALLYLETPHRGPEFTTVSVAGKTEPLAVACFHSRDELQALLGEAAEA